MVDMSTRCILFIIINIIILMQNYHLNGKIAYFVSVAACPPKGAEAEPTSAKPTDVSPS